MLRNSRAQTITQLELRRIAKFVIKCNGNCKMNLFEYSTFFYKLLYFCFLCGYVERLQREYGANRNNCFFVKKKGEGRYEKRECRSI